MKAQGIIVPNECLRNENCQPYGQLIATDDIAGFICCGSREQYEHIDERDAQDKYCLCYKNDLVDHHTYNDKRDLIDHISVIAQALSVIANLEVEDE